MRACRQARVISTTTANALPSKVTDGAVPGDRSTLHLAGRPTAHDRYRVGRGSWLR
jgi:hypothetical protein